MQRLLKLVNLKKKNIHLRGKANDKAEGSVLFARDTGSHHAPGHVRLWHQDKGPAEVQSGFPLPRPEACPQRLLNHHVYVDQSS